MCKSENICVGKFYVKFTQARLTEEEELSTEKKNGSLDWPVGKPVGRFLN